MNIKCHNASTPQPTASSIALPGYITLNIKYTEHFMSNINSTHLISSQLAPNELGELDNYGAYIVSGPFAER